MTEKPNQEAYSQTSEIDENELQKLEEEYRRQSECKFALLSETRSISSCIYADQTAC